MSTDRLELSRFFSQFNVLLNGGITVTDALELLARDTTSPAVAEALRAVNAHVKTGAAMHEAFAKHPALFPRAIVALTRAGEHSGLLDSTAERSAIELIRPAEKRTRESETGLALRMIASVMTAGVPADEAIPLLDGLVEETRTAADAAKAIARMKEEAPLEEVLAPFLEGMPAFVPEMLADAAREDEEEGTAVRVTPLLDALAAGLESGWLTRDRAERPLAQELRTVFHLFARFVGMGLPLDEVFPRIATAVARKEVVAALDEIHKTLGNREMVADGMAKHPGVFSAAATALIRAGEEGGSNLARVLDALADGIERGLFVPKPA